MKWLTVWWTMTVWHSVIFLFHCLQVSSVPFSRWTWVSRCLLKQRMMEVVVTTEAISHAKLQSNHHHQQTNIQFFTGRTPFLSPNQQCQCTEGSNITFHRLAYPKLTFGSSNFLWPLTAPGYLGERCHASHQPSQSHASRIFHDLTNTDSFTSYISSVSRSTELSNDIVLLLFCNLLLYNVDFCEIV